MGRTVRGNIDWTQIWTKLKKIKVTNKVKEFQCKYLHNINYTDHRLEKMNLSDGKCHLCQIRDNDETMQHLFFKCPPSVKKVIKEIEVIFNRSGLTANIEIKESNIILYYTLRFYFPYLSLLAQPVTIFVYGPVVYGPARYLHYFR